MEKIKSVLSGHKKSEDTTHDAPTSSTAGAQHDSSQSHPIYDSMKGTSTTTDPSMPSSQATSAPLGAGPETSNTAAPSSHVTTTSDATRPDVNPRGAAHMHEGMSQASVKSGVIGYGSGQPQGHTALSSLKPASDQVAGGNSTERQPLDQRQESYTTDTDRSFPLAGGVAPRSGVDERQTRDEATTLHPVTSSREPGTKEKEVAAKDGQGRGGLAGAAAAAAAAIGLGGSKHDDGKSTTRETSQVPASSSTTQKVHPEALAAATAAASKSAAMPPPTQTQGAGSHDSSFGSSAPAAAGLAGSQRPGPTRSDTHPHIPGEFPSPTPDESKTFLYYRDEVVPEPGVDGPVYEAHKGIHPEHLDRPHEFAKTPAAGLAAGTAGALAGSHGTDSHPTGTTAGTGPSTTTGAAPGQHELRHTGSLEDPTPRSEDHHHGRDAAIAGGLGAGAAGLGYAATRDRDEPSATGSNIMPHEASPYSSKQLDPRALGSAGGMEEQRYDPQAASSAHQSSPSSNVAAVPGASQHTSPSSNVAAVPSTSQHTSPTSNVAAVPAFSHQSHHDDKLEKKSGGSHHDEKEKEKSSTGPHKSSLLNKLDPRVKSDSSKKADTPETTKKQDEPESHRGRDAALVGAGGLGGAALAHHAMDRDDEPRTGNSTGTSGLPRDQATAFGVVPSSSTTTAPHQTSNTSSAVPLTSTTTAPHQTSNTSAPLTDPTTTTTPYSSTTAPHSTTQHSANTSAPLAASTTAGSHQTAASTSDTPFETYRGPKTTSGEPFYGAAGAPAPVSDDHSHGRTSTSSATAPGTQSQDKDHHYGRDAGLAGAGLATAGGLAYASQRDDKTDNAPSSSTAPTSSTVGTHLSNPSHRSHQTPGSTTHDSTSKTTEPHKSHIANVLDPRVKSETEKEKSHITDAHHQSSTLSRDDEKSQHHYGRDAAAVGGAGAAGYGIHEIAEAYGSHRSVQPNAAMDDQRYDPTAKGAHAPSPVPVAGHYDYNDEATRRNVERGTGGVAGASALGGFGHRGDSRGPTTSGQSTTSSGQPMGSDRAHDGHDNTGRNAALGAGALVGAGALGGAAYAGSKRHDDPSHVPATSGQPISSSQPMSSNQPMSSSQPMTSSHPGQTMPMSEPYPSQGPYDNAAAHDHTGRNVGLWSCRMEPVECRGCSEERRYFAQGKAELDDRVDRDSDELMWQLVPGLDGCMHLARERNPDSDLGPESDGHGLARGMVPTWGAPGP